MKKILAIIIILNFQISSNAQSPYWGNLFYLGEKTGLTKTDNITSIDNNQNWSYRGLYPLPNFTFGIKSNRTLWVVGSDNYAYSFNHADSFVQFDTSVNWIKFDATSTNAIALKTDSSLWTLGNNDYSQTGHTNSKFTKISNSKWKSISAGNYKNYAIRNDGTLWAAGYPFTFYQGLVKIDSSTDYVNVYSTHTGEAYAIKTDNILYKVTHNIYPRKYSYDSSSTWKELYPSKYSADCIGLKIDGTIYYINSNSITKINTSKKNWLYISVGDGSSNLHYGIDDKYQLYSWSNSDTPQISTLTAYKNFGFVKQNGVGGLVGMFTEKLWQTSGLSSNYDTLNSLRFLNWTRTDYDSVIVQNQTNVTRQRLGFDNITISNSGTLILNADFQCNNLHLNNGTIDLNGHRLTITGGIYQSTDSTNYYIQAGTSSSPKPLSELVFTPTANTSSTLYFNPNANTLKVFELGTATKTAQVTLGNALKIKGGKTPSSVGSLKVNNGSKLIIPSGATLTLACDTFNSYLNLSHPAQRAIHCSGTGTFNIERQHYGARGWRLYSHPFTSDINLTQIADDIDLIGSGGTAEGFADDVHKNTSAYWYDYSQADTTLDTDPAWTGFSSAKGTLLSGNPNKWRKHSPVIVFNPGAVKGTGAFSNPSAATYQEGKITLSYVLDSNAVHLNDGSTQTISTAVLSTSPKSRFFLLTNPFTAPIRLGRIQGLNLTNCANKFYYWKQNQASISSNFMPAAWASEALFNGNATRDSNISIPAFGTILIAMNDPSSATTFTIPESAKQLTNFNYLVGGDIASSGSGVKQTLFMEIPQTYQGPGAIEVQLLMNDSVLVDRMLIYDRAGESPFFTNNDAKKFKEPSFSNIYSLARGGELLSLDAQDISERIQSGEPSVEIPLIIERDFNYSQKNLRLRIWEKHSELQSYFKDAKTGQEYPAASFDDLPIAFEADETVINRYSLVFKHNSSSTGDLTQKPNLANSAPMELLVYPNPADDQLQLKVINSNFELPFQIYSITGVKVMEGSIKSQKTINSARLDAGVFVIDAGGLKVKFVKR